MTGGTKIMDLGIEHILGGGGALVTIGIAWGLAKNQAKHISDQIRDVWKEITKIRDWRGEHERDSMTYRISVEKGFGHIHEFVSKKDAQYDEILRRLESIDLRMERIESRNK